MIYFVLLQEYIDEIERLKREVQKYRNELQNRESNFNRMFVDQNPVMVERRASRMSSSSFDSPIHFRYKERATSSGRASVETDDELSSMVITN